MRATHLRLLITEGIPMNAITPGLVIKSIPLLFATLLMSVLLLGMAACQKDEGPAEQVGKKVAQAAEKVGEKIEKAGEHIQDAAQGDKR